MRKSISLQKSADELVDSDDVFDSVLITDQSEIPTDITVMFGGRVIRTDPFHHDIEAERRYFCLAKFRNVSIDYAVSNDYDWMMLCDSDTVVLRKSFKMPETCYGVPQVYWQRHEAEGVSESLSNIQTLADPFSHGNSWFILGRTLLERFRFNEQIYGYGYEDREFDERVLASGYHLKKTSLTVIHAYHPHEDRNIDSLSERRNRSIFEATKCLLSLGLRFDHSPRVKMISATHPDWKSNLFLFTDLKHVYHEANGSIGTFMLREDELTIQWKDFPIEHFFFDGSIFVSERIPRSGH
jgi:hypothetical protein